MMLAVPGGCPLHALFQLDSGRVAQFRSSSADIVHATVREKLDATARKWGMLTLHTWHDGKDIRGKIGKPERDTTTGEIPTQRVRNSSGEFANGNGVISRNGIGATQSLGVLGTEQKGRHQVINVERVQ